jgi:hypothetical protein
MEFVAHFGYRLGHQVRFEPRLYLPDSRIMAQRLGISGAQKGLGQNGDPRALLRRLIRIDLSRSVRCKRDLAELQAPPSPGGPCGGLILGGIGEGGFGPRGIVHQ